MALVVDESVAVGVAALDQPAERGTDGGCQLGEIAPVEGTPPPGLGGEANEQRRRVDRAVVPVAFGERPAPATTSQLVEDLARLLLGSRDVLSALQLGEGASGGDICVVGSDVVTNLFPNESADRVIGQDIWVGGHRYIIVGVLQPLGKIFGISRDTRVYIPFATYKKRFGVDFSGAAYAPQGSLVVFVQTESPAQLEAAEDQVRAILTHEPSDGHGVIGMRERAALFGGTLSTEAVPGGFKVTATLPYTPVPS